MWVFWNDLLKTAETLFCKVCKKQNQIFLHFLQLLPCSFLRSLDHVHLGTADLLFSFKCQTLLRIFFSIIKELDLPWKSECLFKSITEPDTFAWGGAWSPFHWIQRRHCVVATCSWLYILILFSSQLCRLQGWERLLEEWKNHLCEDTWEQPAGYRDVWLSNTVDKKPLPLTHGGVQPQVRRASWLRFWPALEEQRYEYSIS